MSDLKKRYITISVFIGIIIGIAISLIAGAIISHIDPGTSLTQKKKIFGDVKIYTVRAADNEFLQTQGVEKMLVMEKNGDIFLYASENKDGRVTGVYILNPSLNKKEPVLILNLDNDRWYTYYSKAMVSGYPVGEVCMDADFDGHFDAKLVADGNDNSISRLILIDGQWCEVESYNVQAGEATAGTQNYIFDPNSSSWKKQ